MKRTPHVRPARLKAHILDGIQMMDERIPIGKLYYVDVGCQQHMQWHNAQRGRQRDLVCVRDVMDGGWLPLELLEVL